MKSTRLAGSNLGSAALASTIIISLCLSTATSRTAQAPPFIYTRVIYTRATLFRTFFQHICAPRTEHAANPAAFTPYIFYSL